MILDLHSHRSAPYPAGILSLTSPLAPLLPQQQYSAGLHPWYLPATHDELEAQLRSLEQVACMDQVVAIGEAGLDASRVAAGWLQLTAFKRQAMIAESVGKPLIIHDVRCHEAILALKKELRPRSLWILHGFRSRPEVAKMFISHGIALSFGERFNPLTLRMTPPGMIYAETDMSTLPISDIISRLSAACGRDMQPQIAANITDTINPLCK